MDIGLVEMAAIAVLLAGGLAGAVSASMRRRLLRWGRAQLDAIVRGGSQQQPGGGGSSGADGRGAAGAESGEGARQALWNAAMAKLAHELGLSHVRAEQGYDQLRGTIGGSAISVRVDAPEGGGPAQQMCLDVSVREQPQLFVKRQGGPQHMAEHQAGAPTALGDIAFDRIVDLRGAPLPLLDALQRQPVLRDLTMRAVERGAVVTARSVTALIRPISHDLVHLRSYLEPMLDLARRIDDPHGSHEHPAIGTPAAAALRRATQQSAQERDAQLRLIVDQLTAAMGQGRASASPQGIAWRGMYQQQLPVGLLVDAAAQVRVWAEAVQRHGQLRLEWDMAQLGRHAAGAGPLFVGRGAYLGAAPHEEDLCAARYRSLPPQALGGLTRAMAADHVRCVQALPSRVEMELRPRVDQMLDPEGQLTRVLQLAGWLAQVLASSPVDPALAQLTQTGFRPGVVAPLDKRTCPRCSNRFLVITHDERCPNC